MMTICKNEILILMRYSNKIESDCVNKHIDILNKNGKVWFAKCGNKLTNKNIDMFMNNNQHRIILYSRDGIFLANVTEIRFDKPKDCYPNYYDELFFNDKKDSYSEFTYTPSTYYCFDSIIELDETVISKFIMLRSEKPVLDVVNKTMTSQMLIKSLEKIEI